ncbi:MAG: glycosyltransferase family 4 protein [Planctomycetes bacterium]|nr:glycosyltransferase family 4 protein [Planctomycetota bacterium]
MSLTWHLITGEYPDQPGGVSDYTRSIARGLANRGEDVHVWAPNCRYATPLDDGVTVHRLPGRFGFRTLHKLAATLNTWPRPSRLLVQYVPHAFGWKAMNIGFARWLSRRRQPVWIMFHEVAFPWRRGQSLKHQFLGFVTSWMARSIARSAERNFVSIPTWRDMLPRECQGSDRTYWLPIPSNVSTNVNEQGALSRRAALSIDPVSPVVGHFGTYGTLITQILKPSLHGILNRNPSVQCILMGRNSDRFAQEFAGYANRVHATGELPPDLLAQHISACDVILQPYPDGISCRRGSVMASLALGKSVVSTLGDLSESFWSTSGAVALGPADKPDELISLIEKVFTDKSQRVHLETRARQLYSEKFAIERTINVLCGIEPALPFPDAAK